MMTAVRDLCYVFVCIIRDRVSWHLCSLVRFVHYLKWLFLCFVTAILYVCSLYVLCLLPDKRSHAIACGPLHTVRGCRDINKYCSMVCSDPHCVFYVCYFWYSMNTTPLSGDVVSHFCNHLKRILGFSSLFHTHTHTHTTHTHAYTTHTHTYTHTHKHTHTTHATYTHTHTHTHTQHTHTHAHTNTHTPHTHTHTHNAVLLLRHSSAN